MHRLLFLALTCLAFFACQAADPPSIEVAEPATPVTGGWGKADSPGALIRHLDHGTWVDRSRQGRFAVLSAWVDARVVDHRYHKRAFVEVDVPYSDGSSLRSLWPLAYKGEYRGDERWGTDHIEIFPDGGPFGAEVSGPIGARLRIQHDADGEVMYVGPWFTLVGPGEYSAGADPWLDLEPSETRGDGTSDVSFGPLQDPGALILEEIRRVTADPRPNRTLRAAVFELSDPEIVDALIEAHVAGVDVRVITDPHKIRPWATWLDGDDRLRRAGVPLMTVHFPDGAMHLKLGLFDGRAVTTGSANWASGARWRNDEYTLRTTDPTVYASYDAQFRALAGGVEVSTGPAVFDRAIPDRLRDLVDGSVESIELAMFTAKDYGRERSLFAALHDALDRGVRVTLVTDARFADDDTDDLLEAAGAHVVRADVRHRHAAMHHKFAVFDGRVAAVGAVNWYYDALYRNAEDLLVLHDPNLVAQFAGEIVDLQARYDPAFDPEPHAVIVEFEAHHDATRYGDTVVVVGSIPELGDWDPHRGLHLNGADWPTWRGAITLPRGRHFKWKLAVVTPFGARFEQGEDRVLRASQGPVRADWR